MKQGIIVAYVEIQDWPAIVVLVWPKTTRTTATRDCERIVHAFFPLYLLLFSVSLNRSKVKKRKKKEGAYGRFYGSQRHGRRFQSDCTTRPNRPNQISVHAMSVKFNSRSISAFDARPSIIPGFIASSRVIRCDVEVLFKKKEKEEKDRRERERRSLMLARYNNASKVLQTVKRCTFFWCASFILECKRKFI